MIENRPTGDADAVGAINKVLRSLSLMLADEAGLTRLAGWQGQVLQKAGAHFGRTRQAAKLGSKSNSRTVEWSRQASWFLRRALLGGERRFWRARED
jgi:hypothetical protein